MELARLSGELNAVSRIVARLQMPTLSDYLIDRSGVLSDLAVSTIVRATSTRSLATAMAVTGAEIGELSAEDVASGVARLAASGALADATADLEAEASLRAATGIAEIEESGRLDQSARAEEIVGVAESLAGSAAER
ncbi:MAG: hypothetical protein JO023_17175 [Chloroflexi bacterium]|nr:hypothetical protein [Chloroflexota bacterium]